MIVRISTMAVLALAVGCSVGHGQPREVLRPEEAVQRFRATGNNSGVVAFLTQEGRYRQPRDLAAVVDSLVAIATGYSPLDPGTSRQLARSAVVALAVAGNSEHVSERSRAVREGPPPVVYTGAFDALVTVFERSSDRAFRGTVLGAMTSLADRGRVLAYLGDAAKAKDSTARSAVHYLSIDMGSAGLELLRRLYQSNAVVEADARRQLEALARAHGW
jgi:hypothetical protein